MSLNPPSTPDDGISFDTSNDSRMISSPTESLQVTSLNLASSSMDVALEITVPDPGDGRESVQQVSERASDRTQPMDFGGATANGNEALEIFNEVCGCLLGRFRLEKVIARGGMGVIYKARDLEVDREVAVKLLLPAHREKPHLIQQFVNEARITGRLQHPGVVPIYSTGTSDDQRPWFAMKLVRGRTLAEMLMDRSGPEEDLPRLLKAFEQVCQTLAYSHACGIIHLDVKPANVMVGKYGDVHLMDWGLARTSSIRCVASDVRTSGEPAMEMLQERFALHDLQGEVPVGAVWGTPAYMSPEQAQGLCTDVRSDVFGLGGILTEILTGRPPYLGRNLVDVCCMAARADLEDAFVALSDCSADPSLIRLAMACLAPEPDRRPADATLVARELTLYLESLHQHAARDLARFFELSLDLFCIAGLDGYFRRVNSNFSRVLGFTDRQLLTQPFLTFVHPDDRERTVHAMRQLNNGQPVVRFQNRYQTAYQSFRILEWTAKSIPDDGIIFAVARDVTEECPL